MFFTKSYYIILKPIFVERITVFWFPYLLYWGRDSVVSITTHYCLGVRGSNPGGARFSGHIHPSVQWVLGLGVKQLGRGADLKSAGSIMGAAIPLTPPLCLFNMEQDIFSFYLLIYSCTVYLKAL